MTHSFLKLKYINPYLAIAEKIVTWGICLPCNLKLEEIEDIRTINVKGEIEYAALKLCRENFKNIDVCLYRIDNGHLDVF